MVEKEFNAVKDSLINLLKKSKRKETVEFLEKFPEFFQEIWFKNPMAQEYTYIKDIWSIKDTRLLVITAHLYNENFMDEIFKEKYKNWEHLLDFSFHQKVNLLYAANPISKSLFDNLLILNQLRNKYAHNLEFDIIDFDLSKFSGLTEIMKHVNWKRKKDLRKLYHFLLILQLFWILSRLTLSELRMKDFS